jgi:hypothetical protein
LECFQIGEERKPILAVAKGCVCVCFYSSSATIEPAGLEGVGDFKPEILGLAANSVERSELS